MNTLDEHSLLVSEKIAQLNSEYNQRLISEELQILRPYLKGMQTFSSLQTVQKQSQPFAFSLIISSIGIYKSTSPFGVIGPALERLCDAIVDVGNALYKKQSLGNRKLLKDGFTLITTGIVIFAAIGAAEGIADSSYDEEARKEIDSFGLELLTLIGIFSETPYLLYETLTELCRFPEEIQELVTNILTTIGIILAIWTVSQKKGPDLDMLIRGAKPHLLKYLSKIEIGVENMVTHQTLTNDNTREVVIVIKQVKNSLETDNFERFIESIDSALRIINLSAKTMEEELINMCIEAKDLVTLMQQKDDAALNSLTGIWQAG